jgi:hypothetical protein
MAAKKTFFNPFRRRFLFLLVSMLLFFVIRPFLEGYVAIGTLLELFFTFILFSAVYAVSERKIHFVIALFIAICEAVIGWWPNVENIPSLLIMRNTLLILFFFYISILVFVHVFSQDEVTPDVIMGAVCIYVFLGLMWGFAYALLERLQPGSFLVGQEGVGDESEFIYYSFVTQTTLGYGEITPLTRPARSLAVVEAVIGQLYLAITIARLVGIHIAERSQRRPNSQ